MSKNKTIDFFEEMDDGPWVIFCDSNNIIKGVISEDFTHDVHLEVKGDFTNQEQKEEYCRLLCEKLNSYNRIDKNQKFLLFSIPPSFWWS